MFDAPNIETKEKQKFRVLKKYVHFLYPSAKNIVLGAEKNHLTEMVLLSTHNACFTCVIRKIIFIYVFLSGYLEHGLILRVTPPPLKNHKKYSFFLLILV